MTIPKREAVDGPGFDAEFCLLAELAGLELPAEIPVVTPTDLGALKTMVCRAIDLVCYFLIQRPLCGDRFVYSGHPVC